MATGAPGDPMAYPAEKRRRVRDDYLLGAGISELADRYGIRRQTISGWAQRDGWQELRTRIEREADALAAGTIARELAAHNGAMSRTWGDFLDRVTVRLEDDKQAPMAPRELLALADVVARLQAGTRKALNADLPGVEDDREIHVSYEPLREALLAEQGEADAGG